MLLTAKPMAPFYVAGTLLATIPRFQSRKLSYDAEKTGR
jgi:hypothetical protein